MICQRFDGMSHTEIIAGLPHWCRSLGQLDKLIDSLDWCNGVWGVVSRTVLLVIPVSVTIVTNFTDGRQGVVSATITRCVSVQVLHDSHILRHEESRILRLDGSRN